jgi:class 3 adenylate cyclase
MVRSSTENAQLEMFCVLYVDMKGSTYATTRLHPEDYALYYATFYDILSDLACKFGGKVIKHVGDALIICFPATSDPSNREAFKTMLDCGMTMLEARCTINNAYCEKNLPPLSYRISVDYGRMESVETTTSLTPDWIGPPMNLVAKMNHLATENVIVIGGDLHQILLRFSFEDFHFEPIAELDVGIKQQYPVYSVARRDRIMTKVELPPILARKGKQGAPSGSISRPNVLIVDDESDILYVYKEYLAGQPVNVEVFADPLQLLSHLVLVGPAYYDLAVLDIRMPKMNGFQLYQLLVALNPKIKALFVSEIEYAEEFLSILHVIDREADFIKKPVTKEQFMNAVYSKIKL